MRTRFRDSATESSVVRAVGLALGRVQPSAAFRRHLSGNLQLAARYKVTGEPAIEEPTVLSRTAIMIAGIVGLVAALVAMLLYFREGQKRESSSSATQ